ncbi:hypothetical protein [Streptosporangium vulgare]|uniref:Helix-turn-helix domain-containing protein n=1 Tax=Streptosporangium vulgare TaxID=46190 RepID=A0ABV5TQ88_9ACTN
MTEAEKELDLAVKALKRAPTGKRAAARARVRAAVAEVLRAGKPVMEVVELSGYSRERVRQVARAAGIEAPPEQRAKGRPKQTAPGSSASD